MNHTGDDREDPGLPPPGLPLSAPSAADVLPSRVVSSFLPHAAVAAQPAAPASASIEPVGYHAESVPPAADPRPAGYPAESLPPAAHPPAGAAAADPEHAGAAVADPEPAGAPPAGQAAAVGRGGHDFVPEFPAPTDYFIPGSSPGEPPEDPNRVILRKHLDAVRLRAASASSWLESSAHYARLINRDGSVPVTARLSRDDIEFLGRAREEVLGFAELGLRLLELHAPLDAGGISTDPSSPILRCRSCMWRWPCPTFGMLTDALIRLPHPGSPPAG